jgi:hypothetical protein
MWNISENHPSEPFFHPEFVPQDYREAQSETSRNCADLARMAKVSTLAGRFRRAPPRRRSHGCASLRAFSSQKVNAMALQISGRPRFQQVPPTLDEMDALNITGV